MNNKALSFLIIGIITLVLALGAMPLLAAEEANLKNEIENYFSMKYSSLMQLELHSDYKNIFVDEVFNQSYTLTEYDRLYGLIEYRKIQNNDLSLLKYDFDLRYLAVNLIGQRAEVLLEETYEYYFNSTPSVPHRGVVLHALTLDGKDSAWRFVRDDYIDPDGFNNLLEDALKIPGNKKEDAIASIIAKAEAMDAAWNERMTELLYPYPDILVLMHGQCYAWLDGRVQRLDPEKKVTPSLFYNADLYVPLRVLVERLGGEINWLEATNSVEAMVSERQLVFNTSEPRVLLDGQEIVLEHAFPIVSDRVMLPVSLVSEYLQRSLYEDNNGLAIMAKEPLDVIQQAELHAKLSSLYLERFSLGNFPRIDGSTSTYPLSIALGQELLSIDETAIHGYISHNQTHNAYVNLLNNNTDLILVTPPSDAELQMAKDAGIELDIIPICKEGFVFLVNERNPVTSLSQEQIEKIYKGTIKNWSEVGGDNLDIIAYQRNANSGSQTLMETIVMKDIVMTTAPKDQIIMGMGMLVESVADYTNARGALGYSVYYYATTMYSNRAIRLVAIDGITPDDATLRAGSYPYTVSYYAVMRRSEPENSPARRLVAWLLSEAGQEVVTKAGFVAL